MNLAASISNTIRIGAVDQQLTELLLTRDRTKAKNKNEGEYWDYKQTVDLGNPLEVAKLAKRVLGFFNNKGGAIFFGIDDEYVVRGIAWNLILDTKQLNDRLRPYVGPRVSVFQDVFELKGGKLIWAIFVRRREGLPVALQKDGPQDSNGRVDVRKNSFFLRVNDEVKTCLDPVDLCSLFADVDASLQSAYAFDIDEPYFRVLAHHCDRFVGRQAVLDDVRDALALRHPIISFDGLGGVGKSAIAIELTRQLYEAKEYQFIVSLSAKSRVWQGHVATRVAGFSGITEFLREIGSVLGIGEQADLDSLRREIISLMRGIRGLILVDNIEDIHDEQIFRFLSREVPDPVKVIVTSRIDRGLGAISVSIPEMTDLEARELFEHELERQGFARKVADTSAVKRILEATGRLPLAIKWAASIAAKGQSLASAERVFAGCPAEKTEFLSFCFKTMFDQLPILARQVAILCPYLDDSWTLPVLSIALDAPEQDILEAIHELKERGIALSTGSSKEQMPRVLPLTRDFLAATLRDDRMIEETAEARLAKALGDANPLVAGIGSSRRMALLLTAIKKRLTEGELYEAERLLKYATEISRGSQDPWLIFLTGQLEYLKGKRPEGRQLMESAVRASSNDALKIELEQRIGLQLIYADSREERQVGASFLLKAIAKGADVPVASLCRIAETSLKQNDYESLRALCSCRFTPTHALEIVRALSKGLERDQQLQYQIGPHLIEVFECALRSRSQDLDDEERSRITRRVSNFRSKLV